ncbi:hypothetical protein [Bacillus toyonensis]|uniref:hypothetical protein n=1 Tax=Bacillus toyonensis TaxID=155322 RepID=UPI000BF1E3C6|nr:hypothetical protein [Bacillus toyonensis]PEL23413.1 hypothetical protein CN624_21165 [Bacillus toyonensis]PFY49105.1 hypothetical protein COL55_13440 [Bacillus toyonensis]PFY86060.1 hypothetical protein COL62_02375 [Bacillus toyonensis]PHD51853.1 hypothetical protein COF75_07430 [Bacillus toyonensis]
MVVHYGYCYDEEGRFTELIPLENTYNEETGEETPLLPPQCTLKRAPDGGFYPRFMGTKWVTREEYTLDENNRPILPEEEITNESI